MKRLMIFVLALAILPIPARGQPAKDAGGGAPAGGRSNTRAMYEEIEIMRQLLARRLITRAVGSGQCLVCHTANAVTFSDVTGAAGVSAHQRIANGVGIIDYDGDGKLDLYVANDGHPRLYRNRGNGTFLADVDNDGWADLYIANDNYHHYGAAPVSIEGSYLWGRGIVYSLTLPSQPREELKISPPGQPAAGKPSEWDQVRTELRGGKPETPTPAKKLTLLDSLLQVISQNGKNLSQLGSGESLTLVITFRDGSPAKVNRAPTGLSGMGSSSGGGSMGPGMSGGGGGGGSSAGGMGPGMGGPPDGGAGGQSITPDRELELLAELHLKRGNLAEAASAYDRAVGKAREVHIDPALDVQQAKAVMDRANARLQELSRKLAETYLKLNDLEAAKKALAYAPIQLAPKQGTPAAAKPAPVIKLPEKLILTVSKKALDQIGSGAITFAEFQELVTIEIPNVNPVSSPSR